MLKMVRASRSGLKLAEKVWDLRLGTALRGDGQNGLTCLLMWYSQRAGPAL